MRHVLGLLDLQMAMIGWHMGNPNRWNETDCQRMQSLSCKCAFLWHVNITICHKSNDGQKALSIKTRGNANAQAFSGKAIPQFVRSYRPGQKECRNQNFNIMFCHTAKIPTEQNRTEQGRAEQSRHRAQSWSRRYI